MPLCQVLHPSFRQNCRDIYSVSFPAPSLSPIPSCFPWTSHSPSWALKLQYFNEEFLSAKSLANQSDPPLSVASSLDFHWMVADSKEKRTLKKTSVLDTFSSSLINSQTVFYCCHYWDNQFHAGDVFSRNRGSGGSHGTRDHGGSLRRGGSWWDQKLVSESGNEQTLVVWARFLFFQIRVKIW